MGSITTPRRIRDSFTGSLQALVRPVATISSATGRSAWRGCRRYVKTPGSVRNENKPVRGGLQVENDGGRRRVAQPERTQGAGRRRQQDYPSHRGDAAQQGRLRGLHRG